MPYLIYLQAFYVHTSPLPDAMFDLLIVIVNMSKFCHFGHLQTQTFVEVEVEQSALSRRLLTRAITLV